MRDAITNVTHFAKNSLELNIILMNAPHRHDLIPNSCVNKEVAKYNKLMRKVAKQNTNIQFLELDLNRLHFTNHGMHMNSKGKDRSSQHLAQLIGLTFDLHQLPPISVPWKLTSLGPLNAESHAEDMEGSTIQHRRKCP